MDPHSTFVRLWTQYPGVLIDVVGAKDYVPVVEAKIRRVIEMYRAGRAGVEATQVLGFRSTVVLCI